MENFKLASHFTYKYDENEYGKILSGNLEEQMCYFNTSFGRLCCFDELKNFKFLEIEKEVILSAIQLKYLHLSKAFFIATESQLILFDPLTGKHSIVHLFSTKIVQTSWNPTETQLVVIDSESNITGFTFEINEDIEKYQLTESSSARLDEAVPNSVYVGWGSHNTQFKGAKKKEETKVDVTPQDYSPPNISWRGNGEQFVVNFWKDEKRFLKVFNNLLKPLYESDVYPNLLPSVSFKDQGNFIACAARHNKMNKIVIFEKNCLVKSEFFVPQNKGEIKKILYHPERHLLGVFSEDSTGSGFLNIYVNFNAKWYLKQQLYYMPSEKVKLFQWNTIPNRSGCTLYILTSKGVSKIEYDLVINNYPENGLVAVIDGVNVHFTNFSEQIVPPPMSGICLTFDAPVNDIYFIRSQNLYQFFMSDKAVKMYTYDNGKFIESEGANITSDESFPEDSVNIFLNRNQDLCYNNEVVCNNVISMLIYNKYLLFTHASSKLYYVRLTTGKLLNSYWNLDRFYSREVEQGAKIVCVTGKSDIILVIPRGNLETITCRLIAIDNIEQLLQENKWREAVCQIRKQRLNWNLLIDLNPQRFCSHLQEFIEAADTVSILNTIVSEFSNEDCLKTMYAQCVEDHNTFSEYDKTQVLKQILDKIISLNPILNLVSIVTLQTKHFTLKSALKSVCTAFEMGEVEVCKKAVFQILLHTHASKVISESFTLYNIEFMSFIYSCCSEDPRIFEPELEKLKCLSPIELRFRMNVLAKKFHAATKYLIRCTNFDEQYITEFITKHITEKNAYESICSKNTNFILVSKLFAKYLSVRNRHSEAAHVLEKANLLMDALEEHKKALSLENILYLLEELKFEEELKKETLLKVADELINEKKINDAIIVLEHHCKDYEKAINVLVEKKMFQQALSLAKRYNYSNLIGQQIQPAIVKYRMDLNDKIEDLGTKFTRYTARLLEVRQKKLKSFKNKHLEEDSNFENDDLYSEYGSIISSRGSSMGSRSSRNSTLSSRNRRKQEKKKIDIREGGVYEDIALIRQLYILAVDIFACGPEVRDICLTLTNDNSIKHCKEIHEKLNIIQETVKKSIPKIWTETFLNGLESTEPEILAVNQNKIELDAEFRTPPPNDKMVENWKLLIF